MEKDIENLIEELTKVRPSMLNEEALKLFNTIMAILDERDRLKEENRKLQEAVYKEHTSGYSQGVYDCSEGWKEAITEKIEELDKEYHEILKDYGNIDADVIFNIPNENVRKHLDKLVDKIIVLQELMEDK